MKKIVLYGAGGFARETAYLIERINRKHKQYELLGFIVDEQFYVPGTVINDYPVLGTKEWILQNKESVVCCCTIGEPKVRKRIQEELEAEGVEFETLISPDVDIHKTLKIGKGTIICGGCFFTVNITIGKGVIINQATSLGHDVTVGDYSCIMGNCSVNGWTNIGNQVSVGGAAYILPNITVGDEAIVGAGSVVFTRVKQKTHVLGNPAKRIKL